MREPEDRKPIGGDSRSRVRRQHFVPRLLLKGFAHRVKGGNYYTFEFRKGAKPHEVNIINVGVARDFYGRTHDSDIEETLSLREAEYASVVQKLRDGRIDPDQKPLVDDLVTNLIIRTKNVRDGFTEMGSQMFDSFERVIADAQNRAKVERKIIEGVLEDPQIKSFLALLPRALRQGIFLQALSVVAPNPVSTFQKLLQLARPHVDFKQAARGAQLRALALDGALLERRESLKPLLWSIFRLPEGAFVLGDLGPVARFSGCPDLQSPIRSGRTPEAIFLPIAKQCLLVGRPDGVAETVDVETVNTASVELSRDLFVSSTNTERELNYLKRLGRQATFLEDSKIHESMREIFE